MAFVPTVRVANPTDPKSFITINAEDYRPAAHGELWAEQQAGFAGLPPPPVVSYTAEERVFAAQLMLEAASFKMETKGKEFARLSPAERMVVLRDMRNELEADRASFHKRPEPQPEPEPTKATPVVSESQAPAAPASTETPATTQTPQQSWVKSVSVPQPVVALEVKPGPKGQFYIMKGKAPVGKGFATEAEAKTALEAMSQST